MAKARNTNTTVTDPQVSGSSEEDKSLVVVDHDRSGLDIDREATVNAIVAAFQPIGAQISRLERANELYQSAGYGYTDRSGKTLDIRQLNSTKATLGIICRMAVSLAEGNRRFPDGTKAMLDQAEFKFDSMIDNDPQHASLDRLAADKRIAHHAHFNVALPLAEAMRSVYETLMGEPMPDEKAPKEAAKKRVEIDF